MLFIKHETTNFFFVVNNTATEREFLFKDPDTEDYFFSSEMGGVKKTGAALFHKKEGKRILSYLKDKGYRSVELVKQEGLVAKNGEAFKDHNQGESNIHE